MSQLHPHVIAVLQQKGGVGKTTLSINLAAAFAENGENVLLVDADPQASSMAWSAQRANNHHPALFPIVAMPKSSLHGELPKIKNGFDRVIIDTAPTINEPARSATVAADFALIPVEPSPYAVWSAQEIVSVIWQTQQLRPDLMAAFVINRKKANTRIGQQVADRFAEQPYSVLNTVIQDRIAFANAAEQGLSVLEASNCTQAANDIRQLAKELANLKQERKAA